MGGGRDADNVDQSLYIKVGRSQPETKLLAFEKSYGFPNSFRSSYQKMYVPKDLGMILVTPMLVNKNSSLDERKRRGGLQARLSSLLRIHHTST
jgi:hypothetical protein